MHKVFREICLVVGCLRHRASYSLCTFPSLSFCGKKINTFPLPPIEKAIEGSSNAR